jgi:hypothetical protein
LALKTSTYKNVKILGENLKLKRATEPTNIIWENREYTKVSRFMRFLIVLFILGLILMVSFTTIVTLKKRALSAREKYEK